jgi:hypothetical protein
MTLPSDSCGCDPLRPEPARVDNPPGQPELRWRVAPHSQSLARMRATLGGERMPEVSRGLARQDSSDPAVALLDAWALVADTVSFYTERIAQEGFLRTATELRSVRMLGREIGYELRPGVAAETEVAFDVEEAPGAPEQVTVAPGTPIQSIPGPGQLPQTFETSEELDAHAAWNAIRPPAGVPQSLRLGSATTWVRGTGLGAEQGDGVLLVVDGDHWDFRIVAAVDEEPEGLSGWTRLELEERGATPASFDTANAQLFVFRSRARLFEPAALGSNRLAGPRLRRGGDRHARARRRAPACGRPVLARPGAVGRPQAVPGAKRRARRRG